MTVQIKQIKDGSRSVGLRNLTPARDFIHTSDAAEAIVTPATEFDGDHRAYNIGTRIEYTVREAVRRSVRHLGNLSRLNRTKSASARATAHISNTDVSRMDNEIGWSTSLTLTEGLERLLKSEDII